MPGFFLCFFALLAAADPVPAEVPGPSGVDDSLVAWAVDRLLARDPGRAPYDQWSSRGKVNWFDLYTRCIRSGPEPGVGYYASAPCAHSEVDLASGKRVAGLPRDAASVEAVWRAHRDKLLLAMDADRYRELGLRDTVGALLRTQERLWALSRTDRDGLRAGMEAAGTDGCRVIEERTDLGDPSEIASCWLNSFWLRREAEGNHRVVLGALREVDARYRPSAESVPEPCPTVVKRVPEGEDRAEVLSQLLGQVVAHPDNRPIARAAFSMWLEDQFEWVDLQIARGAEPEMRASCPGPGNGCLASALEPLEAGVRRVHWRDRRGTFVAVVSEGVQVRVYGGTLAGPKGKPPQWELAAWSRDPELSDSLRQLVDGFLTL